MSHTDFPIKIEWNNKQFRVYTLAELANYPGYIVIETCSFDIGI